jgi:hypothetical protein
MQIFRINHKNVQRPVRIDSAGESKNKYIYTHVTFRFALRKTGAESWYLNYHRFMASGTTGGSVFVTSDLG